MTRFRTDNTDGYSTDDLAALNAAWDKLLSEAAECDDPPLDVEMLGDHWAENILHAFDADKPLLDWFYRTGGA